MRHGFAGSLLADGDQSGQQVQMQSSLLAYIDVFWTLMLISLAAVPLTLIPRTIKLGPGRHIDKQECERRSHGSASV